MTEIENRCRYIFKVDEKYCGVGSVANGAAKACAFEYSKYAADLVLDLNAMYAHGCHKVTTTNNIQRLHLGGFMKSLTGLMIFVASWMVVNAVVLRVLKRSFTFAEGIACSLLLMLVISAIMSRI